LLAIASNFANLYDAVGSKEIQRISSDFFDSLRNGALNILKKVSHKVALNPLMGKGSGLGNPCRVRPY
jgi:hypothetical protein